LTQVKSWQKKLPIWATYSRFIAAALLFIVLALPIPGRQWLGAIIFILGSITDWLDGYWARKYNAQTDFGKLMDPVADKVLVLSALILMVYEQRIDPYAPAILLSRDIFIGGIRSIAASHNLIIDAKPAGKWKTALQMIAIPCLIVGYFDPHTIGLTAVPFPGSIDPYRIPFENIGRVIVWISVFFSITSAFEYTKAYREKVKEG
jgi:CDP-diacylglycerol--glycerol-3-phosphate 3-phosphatidyltransferase